MRNYVSRRGIASTMSKVMSITTFMSKTLATK